MKYVAALLALNCLVFAAYTSLHADDLHALYGLAAGTEAVGMPVSLHDLWPGIVSYMFGHAGVIHLIMNMMILAMAGRRLEERAGARIIVVYLAGGVAGAAAYMLYPGTDIPLIGTGAAVSAVFGAAVVCRAVSVSSALYFAFVLNIVSMVGAEAGILPGGGVSFVSHLDGLAACVMLAVCLKASGMLERWRMPVRV